MRKAALGLGLLLSAAGAAAAQADERLLVQETDHLVVVDREVPCGEPVPITIRSLEPGFFGQPENNTRLQHTVDGVRAMLGFECARIPRLDITGEAGADERQVFEGTAGDRTSWLVEGRTDPSVPSRTNDGTGGPLSGQSGADPVPLAGVREIAGVQLGMTVDEAMDAAQASFGDRPRYHEDKNLMQAMDGGCDFRFTGQQAPRPGWRCLEAAFTDGATPRMKALGLAQALDRDQLEAVEDRLVSRFGPPKEIVRDRGVPENGDHPFVYMGWDEVLSTGREGRVEFVNAPLRKLEAYAVVRQGVTVVTLWHQDPDIAAQAEPKYRMKF